MKLSVYRQGAALALSYCLLSVACPAIARPIQAAPGEVRSLVQTLLHGSFGQQNRAAQRLFHLQDPRGNAAVVNLTRARDPQHRARGTWALAIVRPRGCGAILMRLTKDRVAAVRVQAVRGLGLLRYQRGVAALSRCLDDRDRFVRREAVRALARMREKGIPVLERRAVRGNGEVAMLAVTGLGDNPGKKATAALLRVGKRARQQRVRLLAAVELQKRLDWHGAELLAQMLARGRPRGLCLQAAKQLGDELSDRGVRIARHALGLASRGAADAQVRRAAAIALASLKRSETP